MDLPSARGVKFHDGSDFNADAAIWNLDRYFKSDAPQFDPTGGAIARGRNPWIAELPQDRRQHDRDHQPAPAELFSGGARLYVLFEPSAVPKTGSWAEFAKPPSGTGPFKITEFKPRVSVTLAERGLLGPEAGAEARQDGAVPDAGADHPARRAALRPGRLDRGAAARRGAEPQGGRVRDRHQQLSACLAVGAEPRQARRAVEDVRVRRAINYCINREGLGDAAERPRRAGGRRLQQDRPVISASRRSNTPTIRPRPRRC